MTAAAYHALNYTVTATCRACAHESPLDLPALIARGVGDRELDDLPFVCRLCGSRRVAFWVGTQRRDGLAAQN
jgi:hypothetical protein